MLLFGLTVPRGAEAAVFEVRHVAVDVNDTVAYDGMLPDDTVPGVTCDGVAVRRELDSAYLAEIEEMMRIEEIMAEAKREIERYDRNMMRQEMSFDYMELQPLLRGIFLAATERGFIRHDAMFRPVSGTNVRDYGIAVLPLASNWILKAAGVESRSKLRRMATANAMALALTVGITEGTKHAVSERRPDGSDHHALPSGHAAIAFMSATILSREYGYISPWISIGGYATATATEILRVRGNRHWVSDTFIGAGIGIAATNLGYFITDRIFGQDAITPIKLRRKELMNLAKFIDHPSSFGFTTGTEVGSRNVSGAHLVMPDGLASDEILLKAGAGLTASVDGTWYWGKHVGVRGSLRTTSVQAKLYDLTTDSRLGSFTGDTFSMYHCNLGMQLSALTSPESRFAVHAFGGYRWSTDARFVNEDNVLSVVLPSTHCPETGCGFTMDFVTRKNILTGIMFDYTHTFTRIMPDRFSITTTWRLLF